MSSDNTTSRIKLLHESALAVAMAAAIFVMLLAGLLAFNQIKGKVATLVNSREVVRLHDELRLQPKNEALKERIRGLDLQLRRETFYRLRLSHNAALALLGGLAVWLAGAHVVRRLRRRLPDPTQWGERDKTEEWRMLRLARHAVAVVGAGAAFATILLAQQSPCLPPRAAESPSEPDPNGGRRAVAAAAPVGAAPTPARPAPADDFPSPAELQKNWPSFRGPGGSGVAADAVAPAAWNVKTGANIRWKTAVPLPGMSSPVVWSNAVFLTGASPVESRVFRFDADTGRLLWSAPVQAPGLTQRKLPQVNEDTSLAAPTAVTDGRRVYAIFPTGEIAAFDFEGRQVWARYLGSLENSYGYASSLNLYRDRLLIQIDRGTAEDGLSRLLALDARTGKDLWQTKREVAGSWASPILVEVGGQPQLIAIANPLVAAYNPLDGTELWRVKCLESDVAPSPILAGDIVVAVAPNNAIYGVRAGGRGDLTASNVAWKAEDGVPDATSPVSDGRRVYVVSSEGLLTCYNLQTGKPVWNHEYEDKFYASPTIAGDTLILLGRKGTAYLLQTGDTFKEIGRGEVGEECGASPVPRGARLYIRGHKNLFCIEKAETK